MVIPNTSNVDYANCLASGSRSSSMEGACDEEPTVNVASTVLRHSAAPAVGARNHTFA